MAQAPPNRMPWLLVHNGKLGVAYCFYTGTWKKTSAISFSFVGDNHGVSSSAAGLLLLTIDRADRTCFTVYNPLTRSFIELPPMTSIREIRARVIVAGEGDHPETYKVVAMGLDSMNRGVVEIYDSTKKSWGIAPHRLPDFILYYIARCNFVFCSGFFYCVGHYRGNYKIMGFSMTDEISVSKDLPRFVLNLGNQTYLVVCGSQLLVVVTTFQGGNLKQVIICEFEKVNVNSSSSSSQLKLELKLKETVRMPKQCESVNSVNRYPTDGPWPTIRCLGVKDCVCLRFFPYDRALKIITYNIREKTWTELPSVDFEDGYFTNVFEPRPDMKVQ